MDTSRWNIQRQQAPRFQKFKGLKCDTLRRTLQRRCWSCKLNPGFTMDRRQFIHACYAAGAASLLPVVSFAQTSPTAPSRISYLVDTPEIEPAIPRLGLVAVGGVGMVTLYEMAENLSGFHRVIAINTDADALHGVQADRKIRVSHFTLSGRDPQQVAQLALADVPEIAHALAGLDMVLLVAGMGGGTGTSISPVVAQVLRQQGTLSLGFAVMPFDFEGQERLEKAQQGLRALGRELPALIVARNTDIVQACDADTPMDRVLCQAPQAFAQLCRSISQSVPSQQHNINFDIEDLRHLMVQHKGAGAFGSGATTVAHGAVVAAQKAIAHPLLGLQRLRQAQAALVTVESSPNTLRLIDSRNIMALVRSHMPPDADLIYGAAYGPMPAGEAFRVSIWAQGLGNFDARQAVRDTL